MNITLTAGSPAAADVAADLRALADLIDNDGDGLIGATLAAGLKNTHFWPAHSASHEHVGEYDAVMAEAIRRFKSITSTPLSKTYRDEVLEVGVTLRALRLRLLDARANTCERVVTGTETVTEEVPDPDYIAAAPTITRTREVETVAWECKPLLAAAENGQ